MIDPNLLKSDKLFLDVIQNCKRRLILNQESSSYLQVVQERNQSLKKIEEIQAKRNILSKEIGIKVSEGKTEELERIKLEVREINEQLKQFKKDHEDKEDKYSKLLEMLPNMLDSTVPDGKTEEQNKLIRESGKIPSFTFNVKPHYEIAEEQALIDFERGVKISGSRFYVYNEEIAKLERKLSDFMLSIHEKNGYKERGVPFIVKNYCMFGTGQLPKFQDDFYMTNDGYSLIPTGEVPLTNLYRDEIILEEQLPLSLSALTHCFRREVGGAGRDTRGLIRVHQFQKVELVKFCKPEDSEREHELLTKNAEEVLERLGLVYRVMLLCSGDTSAASSKTYDLEVYMSGLKQWKEVSSCSNFKCYQARRANIRYKSQDSQKNHLLHTINGSGMALGRIIVALLEYHQKPDGLIDFDAIYNKLII